MPDASVTAAVLLIGDEILSGRTQDLNLAYIAKGLDQVGIRLREARIVRDSIPEIGVALNHLRKAYDYVFTTGGIGPTHDDLTADAVGAAFRLEVGYHPDAYALLEAHYGAANFNEARKRMARTPVGARLIDNPVSKAPGFQVENVYVFAGIPRVMQAMFDGVLPRLKGGKPLVSRSLSVFLAEGQFGSALSEVQARFPDVAIGSYPFVRQDRYGASLVLRGLDSERVAQAAEATKALLISLGGDPQEERAV